MKIKVTMKDPDTLHDAVADAVRDEVAGLAGLSKDEREAVEEKRREAAMKAASQWFRYSEYLTVEIDTEARTATVCPAS